MTRIFGGRNINHCHTTLGQTITPEPEGEGGPDPRERIANEPLAPPSPSVTCIPLQRFQIEIFVRDVNANGAPLDGVLVRLLNAPNKTIESFTDEGKVSFTGLAGAQYTVTLPCIDSSVCISKLEALAEEGICHGEEPMWVETPAAPRVDPITARPGDCLASLAFEFGTTQEAMAEVVKNKEIKIPNLLQPGVKVTVPEVTPFTVQVNAGQRCVIDVKVPRIQLRLFMKTYGLKPRPNISFDLEVFDDDWNELDGLHNGKTDKDGLIDVSTQASARYARLRLRPDDDEIEYYNLAVGELEPADPECPNGLRARLNNLAFYCNEAPSLSDDSAASSGDRTLQTALDSFAYFSRRNRRSNGAEHISLKQRHGS